MDYVVKSENGPVWCTGPRVSKQCVSMYGNDYNGQKVISIPILINAMPYLENLLPSCPHSNSEISASIIFAECDDLVIENLTGFLINGELNATENVCREILEILKDCNSPVVESFEISQIIPKTKRLRIKKKEMLLKDETIMKNEETKVSEEGKKRKIEDTKVCDENKKRKKHKIKVIENEGENSVISNAKKTTETETKFKCVTCGKFFSCPSSLRNHSSSSHGNGIKLKEYYFKKGRKQYECRVCGKVLKSKQGINTHLGSKHALIDTLAIERPGVIVINENKVANQEIDINSMLEHNLFEESNQLILSAAALNIAQGIVHMTKLRFFYFCS